MDMAQIVKSSDAPEGEVRVTFAHTSFTVDDGKGYETSDVAVLDSAREHPFLEVDAGDENSAEEQAKALAALAEEQAKVQERNAERARTNSVEPNEVPPRQPGEIEKPSEERSANASPDPEGPDKSKRGSGRKGGSR